MTLERDGLLTEYHTPDWDDVLSEMEESTDIAPVLDYVRRENYYMRNTAHGRAFESRVMAALVSLLIEKPPLSKTPSDDL